MGLQEERLYYNDSYLTEFDSVVTKVKEKDDGQWMRLRESAFYPTSGGQPYDTGVLTLKRGPEDLAFEDAASEEASSGEYAVTAVEVEDGEVWHRIEGLAMDQTDGTPAGRLEVGQAVHGKIDFRRRFDFMQQHSGQHILSACFEQMYAANTSSFHMGDTYSSIDLDVASLSDEDVQRVLFEANHWIWRDVPILARFVTEAELGVMKLRKAPSVTEDIRIVTIEGLEDNACGGTHPSFTGQVGQILVTKMERMRGGVRVTFVCGERALQSAKEAVDTVRTVASTLSVGNSEMMDAVAALQNQVKEKGRNYDALRGRYAALLARDFVARETRVVKGTAVLFSVLPELDEVAELKRMAISSAELLSEGDEGQEGLEGHEGASDEGASDEGASDEGASDEGEGHKGRQGYAGMPQLIVYAGELGGRTHVVAQATDGSVISADGLIKEVLPSLDGKGGGNAKAAQGSAPVSASAVAAAVNAVIARY